MNRRLAIMLLLVVLIFPVQIAMASGGLDDQGNPNDPTVNARANACFEGGAMAGKCDTEWEWTCGWYLIRYNVGMLSRSKVPATCASLLPPKPAVSASTNPGCRLVMTAPTVYYADFDGGNYIPSPALLYSDANCSNHTNETSALLYTLNGEAEALAICQSYNSEVDFAVHDFGYGPMPTGIYVCYVD